MPLNPPVRTPAQYPLVLSFVDSDTSDPNGAPDSEGSLTLTHQESLSDGSTESIPTEDKANVNSLQQLFKVSACYNVLIVKLIPMLLSQYSRFHFDSVPI